VLFVALLLLHTLCFFPTIGLTSTLTFHHINHPEKQFPLIRVFGSLGWILAGVLVRAVLNADETVLPVRIAAIASLAMGLYCFTLPHTPPRAEKGGRSVRDILGLDALKELRTRPFIVFVACELLISIPLSTYYAYAPVYINAAGVEHPAFTMSFGQMSEVVFMFMMPVILIRLGVKPMIVIGFIAWVGRFLLMSFSAPEGVFWMILGGILLHGICFDFVYIAGQIFIDRQVRPAMRGQAQGFLVMMRSGIGLLIGAQASGWLFNRLLDADPLLTHAWRLYWGLPAIFALVLLVGFRFYFAEGTGRRCEESENKSTAG
jgi:nucleoside transporter